MELPVFNVADENAEKGSAASRSPFGSDLGSVVVIFAAMGESQRVVRGTNVRCSTCRHIQWVSVDKAALACERCDAQLRRPAVSGATLAS